MFSGVKNQSVELTHNGFNNSQSAIDEACRREGRVNLWLIVDPLWQEAIAVHLKIDKDVWWGSLLCTVQWSSVLLTSMCFYSEPTFWLKFTISYNQDSQFTQVDSELSINQFHKLNPKISNMYLILPRFTSRLTAKSKPFANDILQFTINHCIDRTPNFTRRNNS